MILALRELHHWLVKHDLKPEDFEVHLVCKNVDAKLRAAAYSGSDVDNLLIDRCPPNRLHENDRGTAFGIPFRIIG